MHICTLTCLAVPFTCCPATSGRSGALSEGISGTSPLGPGARQLGLGKNSSRKARQARVYRGLCVLRRFKQACGMLSLTANACAVCHAGVTCKQVIV